MILCIDVGNTDVAIGGFCGKVGGSAHTGCAADDKHPTEGALMGLCGSVGKSCKIGGAI